MKNPSTKQSEVKTNVIDITDRVATPNYAARLKNLKVRLDLEQAKIAVSTSLLSVVLLVTLANNNLLVTSVQPERADRASRGIASVASVTEVVPNAAENSRMVKELANRALSAGASIGHKPSNVENLAFGILEGKYAVRLQDGKLSEIEYNSGDVVGSDPKAIKDVATFLETQRELLPVAYEKSLKVGSEQAGSDKVETFELVNHVSMPLAKVQVRTDAEGRLLVMKVAAVQLASK